MKRSNCLRIPSTRRRGVVAVLTLVMLFVLLGFAALTVDVGVLYNTRADLQNAADAAALAGATIYASDAMTKVRLGQDGSAAMSEVLASIDKQAEQVGLLNRSFGASGTVVEPHDITTGWIDVESATSPIDPNPAPGKYNAVEVIVRRSNKGSNGPVEFLFAPIFGKHTGEVSASAVAVCDDRFTALDTEAPGAADVWPFTIAVDEYDKWVATGGDVYGYNADSDAVTHGADGLREVQLYPDKLAPGNYGLLNIGTPNQGTPALSKQIEHGVPPDDLKKEIGTSAVTFLNDDGDPISYNITGNPGLKASLEDSIKSRVGDIVAFFLHDHVENSGSNSVYRLTQVRFARVMDVKLQGTASERGLWVQPVTYTGPGVIVVPGAPSSGGVAGKIVLAR